MNDDENIKIVKNIVKKFILAMNKVEEKFIKILDENDEILSDEEKEEFKKDMVSVFNVFCTKKERKYGRENNVVISFPPIYGLGEKIEKTESKNRSRMVVYTKSNDPFCPDHRYTLVERKGAWLIDKKERYSFSEKKWEADIL